MLGPSTPEWAIFAAYQIPVGIRPAKLQRWEDSASLDVEVCGGVFFEPLRSGEAPVVVSGA